MVNAHSLRLTVDERVFDMLSTMKKAFPRTLPVLAGYIFLGIAYGISMKKAGFGAEWSGLVSVIVFGGSMQFALIELLAQPFSPLTIALVTLLVQARHIFYGISMLEQYRGTGKWKPYLIFAMSDETYSLNVQEPPQDVDKAKWYAAISMMDQSYWVIGTLIGALLGSILPLALLNGIDFAMTALFTVIVTEQSAEAVRQVRSGEKKLFEAAFPPLLGLCATVAALLLVGTQYFLLLSMGIMLTAFIICWFTQPAEERTGKDGAACD